MNIDASDNTLEIPGGIFGTVRWINDGLELYYFYYGGIYKVTSPDSTPVQIVRNVTYLSPPCLLSPDRSKIVCTSDNGFSIISLNGAVATISSGVIWSDFDWSADSR